MNYIWELGIRGLWTIAACSALFCGIAGFAIAAGGRFSRTAGTLIGALLWVPGLLGLLVYFSVRRYRDANPGDGLAAAPVVAASPATSAAAQPGYAGFSSFETPTSTSARTAAGVDGTASFGGTGGQNADYSGFGFGSFDSGPELTSVTPVNTVRTDPRFSRLSPGRRLDWARSVRGIVTIGLLVIGGLLFLFTLTSPWFELTSSAIPPIRIYASGTGIDAAILASIVILAGCVAATIARPSRIVAVVVAWLSGSWLVVAVLIISARESVTGILDEAGGFALSLTDLSTLLGVKLADIPEYLDLQQFGVTDVNALGAIDVMSVLPDVEVSLGFSWGIVLGFAVIAHAAVFLLLHSAGRRDRAVRAEGAVQA